MVLRGIYCKNISQKRHLKSLDMYRLIIAIKYCNCDCDSQTQMVIVKYCGKEKIYGRIFSNKCIFLSFVKKSQNFKIILDNLIPCSIMCQIVTFPHFCFGTNVPKRWLNLHYNVRKGWNYSKSCHRILHNLPRMIHWGNIKKHEYMILGMLDAWNSFSLTIL